MYTNFNVCQRCEHQKSHIFFIQIYVNFQSLDIILTNQKQVIYCYLAEKLYFDFFHISGGLQGQTRLSKSNNGFHFSAQQFSLHENSLQ